MFDHFLITRFNVLMLENELPVKETPLVLTESWLEERFELFEKFNLPSIKQQTCQNFRWVVFFDAKTPALFKDRIAQHASNFPVLHHIFLEGPCDYGPLLLEHINQLRSTTASHLITSRVDNDDALHKDYIALIQAQFDGQNQHYIDVRKGYTLMHDERVKLAEIIKEQSPFASLIEKCGEHKTISSRQHFDWDDVESSTVLDDQPLWVQVIHDSNVSNAFGHLGFMVDGGFLVSNYETLQTDFAIVHDEGKEASSAYVNDYNSKLRKELRLKKLKSGLKNILKR